MVSVWAFDPARSPQVGTGAVDRVINTQGTRRR